MPKIATSTTSPLEQYQSLVNTQCIQADPAQQQAIEVLQQLYLALQERTSGSSAVTASFSQVKGVYLWGKVGRGKTFLMDILVGSLPAQWCKRQHFHHFMQEVHDQLKSLAGRSEPLGLIAQRFSQQYRLLCFDEFFVSDIGDAMLLGALLQYLFARNTVVVCTSNCAPDELYKHGLQRQRFLPAIAAITSHNHIVHLNGARDHRQRDLTYVQHYFELPFSVNQQVALHQELLHRYGLSHSSSSTLRILGRDIPCIAQCTTVDTIADNRVCFDFSVLCDGPRSHLDYVAIGKRFTTILLFNIPPMSGQAYERIKARGTEDRGSSINIAAAPTGEREVLLAPMDDAVRRFIALVDECYDRGIRLVITAHCPLFSLYNSGALMFEFERTKSRLVEMSSREYLQASPWYFSGPKGLIQRGNNP